MDDAEVEVFDSSPIESGMSPLTTTETPRSTVPAPKDDAAAFEEVTVESFLAQEAREQGGFDDMLPSIPVRPISEAVTSTRKDEPAIELPNFASIAADGEDDDEFDHDFDAISSNPPPQAQPPLISSLLPVEEVLPVKETLLDDVAPHENEADAPTGTPAGGGSGSIFSEAASALAAIRAVLLEEVKSAEAQAAMEREAAILSTVGVEKEMTTVIEEGEEGEDDDDDDEGEGTDAGKSTENVTAVVPAPVGLPPPLPGDDDDDGFLIVETDAPIIFAVRVTHAADDVGCHYEVVEDDDDDLVESIKLPQRAPPSLPPPATTTSTTVRATGASSVVVGPGVAYAPLVPSPTDHSASPFDVVAVYHQTLTRLCDPVDLAIHLPSIVPTAPPENVGCFGCFSTPTWPSKLRPGRDIVFCLAKLRYKAADPIHSALFPALFRALTGTTFGSRSNGGMTPYGPSSSWQTIGFQRDGDFITDLRDAGMLGPLQVLYLLATFPALAHAIFTASTRDMSQGGFPFMVQSFTFTAKALHALRTGVLTKACSRRGGNDPISTVMDVFNTFYAAIFYIWYREWIEQGMSITSMGRSVAAAVERGTKDPVKAVSSVQAWEEAGGRDADGSVIHFRGSSEGGVDKNDTSSLGFGTSARAGGGKLSQLSF